MNIWYVIAGLGFTGAGIYKIVTNDLKIGIIWVILGILFVLLARYGSPKSKENIDSKNRKKR